MSLRHKKRKFTAGIFMAAALLLGMPASAYAGEWVKSEDDFYNEVWYYTENGNRVKDQWKQIGNYWYYFMPDGSLRVNEWPDGYFVNGDGVWLPEWGKLSDTPIQSGTYEHVGEDFSDTFTVTVYGLPDTGDGIGTADIAHYKRGYYGEGGNGTDMWYEMNGTLSDAGAGSEDNPQGVYGMLFFKDTDSTYTIRPLQDGRIAAEKNGVWELCDRIAE